MNVKLASALIEPAVDVSVRTLLSPPLATIVSVMVEISAFLRLPESLVSEIKIASSEAAVTVVLPVTRVLSTALFPIVLVAIYYPYDIVAPSTEVGIHLLPS